MGHTFTTTHRLTGFLAVSLLAHGLLLLPWRSAPAPRVAPTAFELTRFSLLQDAPAAPVQAPRRVQPSATQTAPQALPQTPKPLPEDTTRSASAPVDTTSAPQDRAQGARLNSLPVAEAAAAPQTDAEHQVAAKEQLRAQLVRLLDEHFTYPYLARKHGWEGTVMLSFQITHEGMIEQVQIRRSSGHGVLDQAALAALTKIAHVDAGPLHLSWETLEMELPVIYRLQES